MAKLVVALVVVAAVSVQEARAVFLGTVTSGTEVQLSVGTPPNNAASTATTVTIVRRGKMTARTFATQPGSAGELRFTPPRGSRVVIDVDAPPSGGAAVVIIQSGTTLQQSVTTDARLVVDAVP